MTFNLDDNFILEKIARAIVGDENTLIPFPYRSGPKLVNLFNQFGYNDEYGQGFQTRWKFAYEKIEDLIAKNKFEDLIEKSLSYGELMSFYPKYSRDDISDLRNSIVESLNSHIFNFTNFNIVLEEDSVVLNEEFELEILGEGYYAHVFLDYLDHKKIAVKKLKRKFKTDREAVHRFKREFEIMETLNDNPYTINVFDYNGEENSFKMELADSNLKKFIDKNFNGLSLNEKESICEEIILGMKSLHQGTTLHRDLSYNNILLIEKTPKLSDFGLGKDLNKTYSFGTVSEDHVGTPHFTDPIQKVNIKHASFQTDIFSLGCIIDYIFSGSLISEDHKYTNLVATAKHRDLNARYKSVEELYEIFIKTKDSDSDFDPISHLSHMIETKNMDSNMIYTYLVRRDAGQILFCLIMNNWKQSFEIFDFFALQYSLEITGLLKKMRQVFFDERIDFSDYDKFSYFSMELLKEVELDVEGVNILAEIINYSAVDVNRFNIQRLVQENKYNQNIPYSARKSWIESF